ncbi:hypothetical protein ASAC_0388 [Acidilobus saccharovorans 345-15]|uniref:Uncharacterized protein n=1 Tax=Acidilobus saccharovorans (strain DSM 16705 / JCM 18335 / VKM B-2471 / 345-15) TaxID=666510 RepID=D9Q0F7_ACIS3|nr:hypothetical protein [Acidilobus saccharovorans]ADL18795.1 hypothetical protein ASAC_0388 [Acidilobus saccharovorans 345-15]
MKEQWETVTDGSLLLGVAALVLDLVEGYYTAEGSLLDAKVSSKILDVTSIREGLSRGSLELYINADWVEPQELDFRGAKISIKATDASQGGLLPLRQLYEELPRELVRLDYFPLYSPLASRTDRDGTEYIIVYTADGRAFVFEGERFRVSLPGLRQSPAVVHTHPAGHCGLSRKDLESGLDLMMDRGLIMGAVTSDRCAAIMYRLGLLEEDDVIGVKEGRIENLRSLRFTRISII